MNEYKKPEITVIYLGLEDIVTLSVDGEVVEPGDDWE